MSEKGRSAETFEEWLLVAGDECEAAKCLYNHGKVQTWPQVQRHLSGAVERLLKAFLCWHGFSAETLRKRFRHDIERLYDEACELEGKIRGFERPIADLARIGYETQGGEGPCTTSMQVGYNPVMQPVDAEQAGFFELYKELRELLVSLPPRPK